MIVLSCADYSFPLLLPCDRFKLLRLLGFERVDLGIFERDARLAPTRMMADPRAFATQLRNDLDNAHLQVADIFLQIGTRPALKQTLMTWPVGNGAVKCFGELSNFVRTWGLSTLPDFPAYGTHLSCARAT